MIRPIYYGTPVIDSNHDRLAVPQVGDLTNEPSLRLGWAAVKPTTRVTLSLSISSTI